MAVRREVQWLEAYRIRQDFSWDRLARDMRRAGVSLSPRGLEYLVKGGAKARPFDRTLFKIRKYAKFLTTTRKRRSAERARRARVSAALVTERV